MKTSTTEVESSTLGVRLIRWCKHNSIAVDTGLMAKLFAGFPRLFIGADRVAEKNKNSSGSGWRSAGSITIRYDTRCYCNVGSKANIGQLNLPHDVASSIPCQGADGL